MNIFDRKLKENGLYPLKVRWVNQIVANVGYRCVQRCRHCYMDSSPERTEEMPLEIVNKLLTILKEHDEISLLEITGGSPEITPYFKYLVSSAVDMGKTVATVSDLVVYTEPGMQDMPEFLAANRVKILASLPHYDEEKVDMVRGKGTYAKSVRALKRLNELGYGEEGSGLKIALVHAPVGPELARDKNILIEEFQTNLKEMHGIVFNHLIIFINMPVGRFRRLLTDTEYTEYMQLLQDNFNPDTIGTLPCRGVVSVAPDGRFFDCDFYVAAGLPVKCESTHVDNFDYALLNNREIATSPLCFLCTAGQGASCADCHS
ncbi:MAG: radical SAM/Cys-rich domain protein [Deferribacteres bacterium]|nr:radical SAM/Cys-rich domain protein [Deferribacteres bacterium]